MVHGDGAQSRDFTYIDDVVEANLLAAAAPEEARGHGVQTTGFTPRQAPWVGEEKRGTIKTVARSSVTIARWASSPVRVEAFTTLPPWVPGKA